MWCGRRAVGDCRHLSISGSDRTLARISHSGQVARSMAKAICVLEKLLPNIPRSECPFPPRPAVDHSGKMFPWTQELTYQSIPSAMQVAEHSVHQQEVQESLKGLGGASPGPEDLNVWHLCVPSFCDDQVLKGGTCRLDKVEGTVSAIDNAGVGQTLSVGDGCPTWGGQEFGERHCFPAMWVLVWQKLLT